MKNYFSTLLLAAIIFVPFTTSAQVTIGSGQEPSQWSLLDLNNSERLRLGEQPKALHLPRMNSDDRDALAAPVSGNERRDPQRGLMLFNTENNCLEFWNGTQWVSLCEGDTPDPCAVFETMNTVFCTAATNGGVAATIADLTARAIEAGGSGEVQWFASTIGGSQLPDATVLMNGTTYWAANCAGYNDRIPVQVSLVDCGVIASANTRITAFVNVMYDFQHQQIEAWTTAGGGATAWQWQMSMDGTNWTNIAGANSAFWTIPAGFMYSSYTGIVEGTAGQSPQSVDYTMRSIYFRCLLSNPTSTDIATNTLNILFIRTNTSGFQIDANGVRSLQINRAVSTATGANATNANTIRMALLNLGQSGTGSWLNGVHQPECADRLNDAGDLGDFYQWGRIADGHQTIVWGKNPVTRANNFDTGTSGIAERYRPDMTFDANGQVTNTPFAGSFIAHGIGGLDWSTGVRNTGTTLPVGNYDLWGNGFGDRNRTPASLAGWTAKAQPNNPCPPSWRIPSAAEFGDMHQSDGTTVGSGTGVSPVVVSGTNGNTFIWRAMQANTNAVGGIILTNDLTGEALFLPAVGRRIYSDGTLSLAGFFGRYWSSTSGDVNTARGLWLDTGVFAGGSAIARTYGASVRCVAD